ncbi:MAG: WG repeat-containing protein [Cyclobacteriaceae bacterium]
MKLIPFLLAWLISASLHAEGYLLFEENGKKGIKNEQGQVVIPASFDALGWSDGSFSVIGQTTGYRLHEQWGLINLNKEFITQPLYTQLIYKSGEYIIARKKINPIADKVGCIS